MGETKGEKRTRWHRLLAKLLEEALGPVGISVFADFPIMANPPEADILLLRNEKEGWTRDQKARLPDGIRDCRAGHVLLEFKYTESVGRRALSQTVSYDHLYRQSQKRKDVSARDICTFLISSKTPAKKTLAKFGFLATAWPGVFRSENAMLKSIPLISLNDLSDEPHNAFFKVFASRRREKRISVDSLMNNDIVSSSPDILWLVEGLASWWFFQKGDNMKDELTPEKAKELGRRFHDALMSTISIGDFLEKFGKDTILSNFRPEEILEKFGKDRLVERLKPEDRLAGLKPEDRLAGLKPEDRLAGLSVEELESYLRKLKKKKK